jgi:hypothetical protein
MSVKTGTIVSHSVAPQWGSGRVIAVASQLFDSEGFDLLADSRKLRIDFNSPINTTEEARVELVKLARM